MALDGDSVSSNDSRRQETHWWHGMVAPYITE